ncbi:MAG: hypothetical protein M3R38_30100 [Actinomycetota bacterium]|nr:hypothetical protein [Actinomycetota bacterium]
MNERERQRVADRMLAIILSGGPKAERLLELLDRAHEAEGEAWQRLERIADQDLETLDKDALASMRSALDQGSAAEEERTSAVRGILEEARRDELQGGEG